MLPSRICQKLLVHLFVHAVYNESCSGGKMHSWFFATKTVEVLTKERLHVYVRLW